MPLNIPSKSEKRASELRDAVRLLAWDAYKIENGLKGQQAFDGYDSFNDEWKLHEIHEWNLVKIEKFIKDLGYAADELMNMRLETYERKSAFKAKDKAKAKATSKNVDVDVDDIPYDY